MHTRECHKEEARFNMRKMKAVKSIFMGILVSFSSTLGIAQSREHNFIFKDADENNPLPYEGKLLYVNPPRYLLPFDNNAGLPLQIIRSKGVDPSQYKDLTTPRFDTERIEIRADMTQQQIETYMGEKILTRLIQREGGKPSSKDLGRSAFGYFDPAICTETRLYSSELALADRQKGHLGYHARASRIEGLPQCTACGFSTENEAQSFGPQLSTPSPIKRQDYTNFNDYLQALDGYLELHARRCIDSWNQSSGHYAAQIRPYYRFCYSMARSKSGKYYCIGLFSNAEFPDLNWKERLLGSHLY